MDPIDWLGKQFLVFFPRNLKPEKRERQQGGPGLGKPPVVLVERQK